MKKILKKQMNRKVSGMGGFFFILVSFLSTVIMITSISYARVNTVMAIADNIAHVITTRVAIDAYNNGEASFKKEGFVLLHNSDKNIYSPIAEFVTMGIDAGIMHASSSKNKLSTIRVKWDANKQTAEVQVGMFTTYHGTKVKPHNRVVKVYK